MKGNFNEIINEDKPVLIDFHAEWCGPCKSQSPIIEEVAKEASDKVRVIKIDIDKNPGIVQRYQIRSVPTLALFKKGQVVWKQAGMHSKTQLIDVINYYTSNVIK